MHAQRGKFVHFPRFVDPTRQVPNGLFKHLDDIQFVSIEYCEEIMEQFKRAHMKVYSCASTKWMESFTT